MFANQTHHIQWTKIQIWFSENTRLITRKNRFLRPVLLARISIPFLLIISFFFFCIIMSNSLKRPYTQHKKSVFIFNLYGIVCLPVSIRNLWLPNQNLLIAILWWGLLMTWREPDFFVSFLKEFNFQFLSIDFNWWTAYTFLVFYLMWKVEKASVFRSFFHLM